MNVFLARQPIFDADLNVVAYELLYRAGEHSTRAEITDANAASKEVLVNAFSEIGLEHITSGKPALVNITEDILVQGDLPKGLQKELIPEILETVLVRPDVVEEVKGLVSLGYRIALDDFVYSDEWLPLLKLAHFVKLDVMALGMERIEEQITQIKTKVDVTGRLLAEKVETREEFDALAALGFSYFQGYFLCKPHMMAGTSVPASSSVLMTLLAELATDNYDAEKVEQIISRDPRLSYKLLRVVNSASFGLAREIKSIRDAVVILGFGELRRWSSMLALNSVDNLPEELIATAVQRAKMSELLALELERDDAGSYFVAGLLSLLDAMLGRPLDELVSSIPLSGAISDAMLKGEGPIGEVLEAVKSYEVADFEHSVVSGISGERLSDIYLESVAWSDQTVRQLAAQNA